MDPLQKSLFNDLQESRKIYLKMIGKMRSGKPLSHKTASAVNHELRSGLRHMERMQSWIIDDEPEEYTRGYFS